MWGVSPASPPISRRTRRARALAWALAGVATALLLIGGSVTALDLGTDGWHGVDEHEGATIVLTQPPTSSDAATGGVRAPLEVLAESEALAPQPAP